MITTGDKAVQDLLRRSLDPGFFKYPKGTKKPLFSKLKGGEWRGQRCFVIGGGPSLRGFDFDRLKGKGRIIVCNKDFLNVPFADMMIAMDQDLYRWIHSGALTKKPANKREIQIKFRNFSGVKVWIEIGNHRLDGVHYVHAFRLPKVTKRFTEGIYSGNNTGTGALMAACTLGCNPIYLLGIDGKHEGKRSHHHGGYPSRPQMAKTAASFVPTFGRVAKPIRKAGIRVINLNPQSAVRCFKFSTLDEVFKNDKIRNNEKEMGGSDIPGAPAVRDEVGMAPGSGTPGKGA